MSDDRGQSKRAQSQFGDYSVTSFPARRRDLNLSVQWPFPLKLAFIFRWIEKRTKKDHGGDDSG